jgi:hypothetical protein
LALHARRASGLLLVIFGLLSVAGPIPAARAAEFEIAPEGFSARLLDPEGRPENLSGAHPDLRIDFALEVEETAPRDLVFGLPPGFGMNARAVPQCGRQVVEAEEECPEQSQIGTFETVLANGAKTELPLFELEPPAGQPITIGTKPAFDLPVTTELRPSDFGITVRASDLPQEKITEGHLELWGVPADHQGEAASLRRALLSAPTACGPLSFTFQARSWEEESPWLSASSETEPLTGCEDLRFEPKLGIHLSNPEVDAPTGMQTVMSMPEEGDPDELAQAQIKNVAVEMPSGIALSPGGAAALTACSDAQLGLGSGAEARCPQSSKVGSVELSTPAIEGVLTGTIYLGEEKPGERFRVFVVARAVGTTVKSVGALRVSPTTGHLSTVLEGLPPLSLSRMAMTFDGGPEALFATPLTCGAVSASARFASYGGGPPVEASGSAAVNTGPGGSPCSAPPFSPQLLTTSSTSRAGHLTTFSSIMRRRPGEQMPSRFSVTMPAGLSAAVNAVQLCSEADAAAARCPQASRVGSVVTVIGSAPGTATLHGGLYFTGPFGGAPFGMAVQIQARLGAFDLGTISMRGAGAVDPRTGRLTISMDQMPESVEGVPVRLQSFQMDMDRTGFIRNPTSCAANSTDAHLVAASGASADLSTPFPVRGCRRLRFRPAIKLALVGRRELRKGGRPGLHVALRLRRHDANLRTMRLSLPAALEFAPGGVEEICSRYDAVRGKCPSGSRIGSATIQTSLLKKPLNGAIFVAQPRGDGLPDTWTRFRGEGIEVNMKGRSVVEDGRLVIDMDGLPDIPLSSLTMRLRQGSQGAISLGGRPCSDGNPRPLGADVAMVGQNGGRRSFRAGIAIKARCSSRRG